jgi:FtsP/CotA-like multicopper oxidase with cupredoxin domain
LRITEGDRVRIIVHSSLPEGTTVHWHGLILPNKMDGPAFITQEPIRSGDSYTYEFTAEQAGTFFYHSHDHPDRQQGLGLYGALIIDPSTLTVIWAKHTLQTTRKETGLDDLRAHKSWLVLF